MFIDIKDGTAIEQDSIKACRFHKADEKEGLKNRVVIDYEVGSSMMNVVIEFPETDPYRAIKLARSIIQKLKKKPSKTDESASSEALDFFMSL